MERKAQSAAGLLLTAAGLIERVGLARSCLVDGDGCMCLVRALQTQVLAGRFLVPWWESDSNEMPDNYRDAILATARYLGWPAWQSAEQIEDSLMSWSDTLARDAGHVAEVLRGAAALFSANLAGTL